MKKFQQEKFKNFFGKPQSKPDRDRTIPIPGLESIPKPGDKIYSQKLVRKREFSNEVVEQTESPNKISKFSDQSKPKSVSTIRKMFEQSVTEQQPVGNPGISTNQKQASLKAAKFATKTMKQKC